MTKRHTLQINVLWTLLFTKEIYIRPTMKLKTIVKVSAYVLSVVLLGVSFALPPQGIIDPSALQGTALLIFGAEWLFGNTVKSFTLDKEGLHFETHEDKNTEQ